MATSVPNNQALIYLLEEQQKNGANADITFHGGTHEGSIAVREGVIVSAATGQLEGNGALMTLSLLSGSNWQVKNDTSSVTRNVNLGTNQIIKFLKATTAQTASPVLGKEDKLLEQAILLFFQFRYKEAGQKIVSILKDNRYYYPAWLWQSRLVTRSENLKKILNEANRWGNRDYQIQLESTKLLPQLAAIKTESVQRCLFCWSVIQNNQRCEHCGAYLKIPSKPDFKEIQVDLIEDTVLHLEEAFRADPQNSQVAYSLGLGFFNLQVRHKSKEFLQKAVELSPQNSVYKNSLTILSPDTPKNDPVPKSVSPSQIASTTKPEARSVLVIEDSYTSRRVLKMLFTRMGVTVLEAATGKEALVLAKEHRVSMIMLDVMLPDTNGYDLARDIRQLDHHRKTPVIMLTGKSDPKSRIRGVNAGADEYLVKPFNPEKLAAIASQYLDINLSSTLKDKPQPKQTKRQKLPSEKATPPSAPKKKVIPSSRKQSSDRKLIFIVEDSPTSRKVLSMVLQKNGFDICEATTGNEAMQIAEEIQPALVLLDVMLPDITGYDILPRLRAMNYYKDIPVVMLTGKKGAADRMKGLMSGTNEYLTKPFNPEKLISVIKKYL